MTNKEEIRIKKQEVYWNNIKVINDNPIDLERYKGQDIEMLNAISLLNQRKQTASLKSIEKNVSFFFWITIISIVISVLVILMTK